MPIATNPVFPALGAGALAFPFSRTPVWQNMVQQSVAGVETPLAMWTFPRYRYKVTAAYLRAAVAFGEFQTLIAFFNSVNGRWGVFQYTDPLDNAAGPDQVFGIGDGATTAFQLVRAFGGFVEPVFAVNSVTNVKKNGVVQSSPSNYSVSNKGVVTFTSAPSFGDTLTWTGTFLWFCRFDTDEQEFSMLVASYTGNNSTDTWGPIFTSSDLTFTTVKFGA